MASMYGRSADQVDIVASSSEGVWTRVIAAPGAAAFWAVRSLYVARFRRNRPPAAAFFGPSRDRLRIGTALPARLCGVARQRCGLAAGSARSVREVEEPA